MTTGRFTGAARAARVALGAAVSLIALAQLTGCASTPASVPVISGRLSLQVAAHADQPARGFNAAFDLRGDAQAGDLRLSTPLGPQIAAARWDPGSVTLTSSEGERRFPDLAALSRELLGEALPLQALPDWLRGRPWPEVPHTVATDGFGQLGWWVDLARQGEGFVSATRDGPPAVTLRVRLLDGTP